MAVRGNYRQRAGGSRGSVEFTGPIWQASAGDVWSGSVRDWLGSLAERGADHARGSFSLKTPSQHFLPGIVGRVRSLKGAPWWLTAVVSQTHVYPWGKGGTVSLDAVTRNKRFTRSERAMAKAMGSGQRTRKVTTLKVQYHGSRGFTGRAEAQYRGGKLEKRHHGFRSTASWLKGEVGRQRDLVRGLDS